MKILIVCHFGLYSDLESSFVHPQAAEYVRMGHEVKVLIPIAYGKPDWDGRRWASALRMSDGAELLPFRYLTLSGYGEKGFNASSAVAVLKMRLGKLLGEFRPDVIHAHTLGFDSTIGVWLKKHYGCPLVVTTSRVRYDPPVPAGGRSRCSKPAVMGRTVWWASARR